MRLFLIAIAILIYFFGCSHFNSEVREACTHGNCKHGWYSKYNHSEKTIASIWMIGYPIIAFVIYSFFSSGKETEKKSRNSSGYVKVIHHTVETNTPSVLPQIPLVTKNDIIEYKEPKKNENLSIDSKSKVLSDYDSVLCPRCGSSMSLRTARRGRYSGRKFWGCDNYPRCKGIINYR